MFLGVVQTLLETGSIRFLFNANFTYTLQTILKFAYPANSLASISLGVDLVQSAIVVLAVLVLAVSMVYFITNKLLPEDIAIVISHNHIDHVAGISGIGEFMLEFYPHSKIKLFMSDTSEKYCDWYYNILKKYSSVFEVQVIDENFEFEFADFNVKFCKTNHCEDKIKSFATKISCDYNSFVYTSDIASVDNELKKFIKNSNVVMVEAGNPIKRIRTLPGYHGNTKDNVYEVLNSGVNNVYLTHLKGCFDESDYINSLYEDTREYVNVIGTETGFDIFTGVILQEYTKKVSALLA